MQSHQKAGHFDFYALFERYLKDDVKAASLLNMHIEQMELRPDEIKYLLTQLNLETLKTDNECNGNAIALLGLLYLRGWYVERSTENALSLINRAIALGNPKALNLRGLMLSIEDKDDETIPFYQKAAELDDPMAMANLAVRYRTGNGISKDHQKAIAWYEKAITLENPYAFASFAKMHQLGIGTPKDYSKAIELLEQGIALGHAEAMNARAIMHEHGHGGAIDIPSALSFYERAIALKHHYAHYNLAKLSLLKMPSVETERKVSKLYRQILISEIISNNNKTEILMALQKSNDFQVKYNLYLASPNNCELSATFLPFFKQHPDEVTPLILQDDLLTPTVFQKAVHIIGEHYLQKANQHLQAIERDQALHDESFLQSLDRVPEQAPQYIESLTMKIDYIANVLSDNVDLPERLLFIESLHQTIMAHDIKILEEKYKKLEEMALNQVSHINVSKLKTDENAMLHLQHQIECIQKLRCYQGPVKNFICSLETSYWKGEKSDIEKHIQSYAYDRLVLDNYVSQCQSFLEALRSLIVSYQNDNKQGLWQSVLPSNLLFLQSDLKTAFAHFANPCPTLLLETMISITKRIQGGTTSAHKKEAAFCEQAQTLLPQWQPPKREARVSMN